MKKIKIKLISMLFVVAILISSIMPVFALEGGQWQSGSSPTYSLPYPFFWNHFSTTGYGTAYDATEQVEVTLTVNIKGEVTFGGKIFKLGLEAGAQARCVFQRDRLDVFEYYSEKWEAYNQITYLYANWYETFNKLTKTWIGHNWTEWRLGSLR